MALRTRSSLSRSHQRNMYPIVQGPTAMDLSVFILYPPESGAQAPRTVVFKAKVDPRLDQEEHFDFILSALRPVGIHNLEFNLEGYVISRSEIYRGQHSKPPRTARRYRALIQGYKPGPKTGQLKITALDWDLSNTR